MFSNGPLHTKEQVLNDQLEQQLCTDTGCSRENLLEAMDDGDKWRERERERERERVKEICASGTT